MARIAICGEVIIATISKVEPTDDGYRVLDSTEALGGAGGIANGLRRQGHDTLLVGAVNAADVTTVKRMSLGDCWLMSHDSPTRRQEFLGVEARIDRGQPTRLVKADAVAMASQVQRFRPDEIRLVEAHDLVLEAICDIGLGGLIYREHVEREQPIESAV